MRGRLQARAQAARLRAEPGGLAARDAGQHPRADADPRLSRDGPPGRRPRSARPHRAQDPQGAAARDLRLHGGRPRPSDLHRQGAGPRDGDHARDPEDPAPHLLPPHRRRVHAHHLAGAEVLDPGAHRGQGQGHRLHRRRQARDPQQADRGRALREVRRREVHRHQALRARRRARRWCRRWSRSSSAAASSASRRSSSAWRIAGASTCSPT